MTFEIELGSGTHAVSVEAGEAPHRYRVTIDGVTSEVDAVQPVPGVWSLLDASTGVVQDVAVATADGRGALAVTVAGRTLTVFVNGRRTRRSASRDGGQGLHKVVAPMPGKVLHVLVQQGDTVAARQPLVVVEAMKMENELSSPRPGRVTSIHVEAGASVEAGRLLLVVE